MKIRNRPGALPPVLSQVMSPHLLGSLSYSHFLSVKREIVKVAAVPLLDFGPIGMDGCDPAGQQAMAVAIGEPHGVKGDDRRVTARQFHVQDDRQAGLREAGKQQSMMAKWVLSEATKAGKVVVTPPDRPRATEAVLLQIVPTIGRGLYRRNRR